LNKKVWTEGKEKQRSETGGRGRNASCWEIQGAKWEKPKGGSKKLIVDGLGKIFLLLKETIYAREGRGEKFTISWKGLFLKKRLY